MIEITFTKSASRRVFSTTSGQPYSRLRPPKKHEIAQGYATIVKYEPSLKISVMQWVLMAQE